MGLCKLLFVNRYKSRVGISFRALSLVCVFALAFAGFVQATHVHAENSKLPSHECSMCSVAHAGVLNNVVCPPVPLFVRTVLVIVSDPVSPSSNLFLLSTFARLPQFRVPSTTP